MPSCPAMPPLDPSTLAKWPNVPACYDWLSLDRRGRWRLQGQAVSHGGLIDFLNRHYGHDNAGCWFVQNGPQRVYVTLEYTPWVLRREADGTLRTHTGQPLAPPGAALIDEEGNLLFVFDQGIGLLHDHDLPTLLAELRDASDKPADETAILSLLDRTQPLPHILWHGLPLQRTERTELPIRFAFTPLPRPPVADTENKTGE